MHNVDGKFVNLIQHWHTNIIEKLKHKQCRNCYLKSTETIQLTYRPTVELNSNILPHNYPYTQISVHL